MASSDGQEIVRLMRELSKLTGIPYRELRSMTQERMERAVIGDDLDPPEEGEYTEIYPDESNS